MSHGTGRSLEVSSDGIADLFFPVYALLFEEDSDFVADIETKLAEARMSDTAELFLSKAIAAGVGVGALLWLLGMLVGYTLFFLGIVGTESLIGLPVPNQRFVELINLIKEPALVLGTGLVFGSLGFAIGFGSFVAIPYSRASARKREINMLLPDAVSFMYALSIGGLNQLEILEAMAKADDTYGEVALEFRAIVQETEYFDTDYRSALRTRSMETPSDELAQFLTDMLSIVNSGGDMSAFLSDKKDSHMRTAQQEQEVTLETLELFGEMYMTLSLFPLLLIIILVIMSMMGSAQMILLYGTIYALIPLVGVGFLVLISTVKQDEPGNGYLQTADGKTPAGGPELFDLSLVDAFRGEYSLFERIRSREGTHRTKQFARAPHLFFRDNPLYILGLTVPLTVVVLATLLAGGRVPTSFEGMVGQPVWSTFVYAYIPVYLNCLPLTVFREWNERSRNRITNKLSANLRKLSSANDTGLTLLESIQTVSDTTTGKLGEEFGIMYAKVNYGMSLKEALVEFNNKYHIPRLARTVKLISKAQEASSQITDVLSTAAQASENTDEIERERKSRTRMQVVIILMTYLTLLAVMAILKTQFLEVMGGLSSSAEGGGGSSAASFGANIDVDRLSLLFFHAVTIQAILSGFIAGYIRDADLLSGVKFVLGLTTVALLTWVFVG